MKPTFIILLFSFIATCSTFAQQSSNYVSGRVTDTNGEPLPGATISIKGKGTGAVTTSDGTYTLQLPGTGVYIITASYVGYQTAEKKFTTDENKKLSFRLSEDQFDLGTVVVTGTRTPKLLKDAPIITRVITSEDIKKVNANNVADLLKTELPGIEFTFAMDQQTSINMQGFGGNSVLFLVDGERLAGETLNNVDYDRLNLDNVERIEIVKGAASALYGSNATGGVINIMTKSEKRDGVHGSAVVSYGSHATVKQAYAVHGKKDKLSWGTFYESKQTNGWKSYNVYLSPEKAGSLTTTAKLDPSADGGKVIGNRGQKYVLSEKASREASALIAARKVSPAVFFTGIYSLIVSFMSGEKDIVALAPVAYGERKVFYRRQGAMMSLPPLLINVAAHDTFAKLLEAISAQNGSFYRHVRTPYQLAARRLEGRNFAFLADTFVNFLPNTPPGTAEFPIVEAEQRHSAKEPILFGTLVMQELRTGCFSLTVRNSRNHLSDRDVERFVARVESVIAQLAAGAEPPKLNYLLDEEKLGLMKPGAYLINTARGNIVNEVALEKMLAEKRLAGAALDVLSAEPGRIDHPLFKYDNFLCTPHMAWHSSESAQELKRKAAEEVRRVMRGEAPLYQVN